MGSVASWLVFIVILLVIAAIIGAVFGHFTHKILGIIAALVVICVGVYAKVML